MVKHEGGPVYGGINTHADTHHVAVIDVHARLLGDVRVPATAAGYRQAARFIGRWPRVVKVGVECTGNYGAAVTRELTAAGHTVIEVNRPNRFERRARGKTDVYDAYCATEAVMTGRAQAAPKGGVGWSRRCVYCARLERRRCGSGPRRSTRSRRCSSPG